MPNVECPSKAYPKHLDTKKARIIIRAFKISLTQQSIAIVLRLERPFLVYTNVFGLLC
jgi:hypothetical protein